MKYTAPNSSLFIKTRTNFMSKMQKNSTAVFFANDVLPVNSDATYRFSQNSNFYYLTGIDQEECILFLFPNAPKKEWREVLFIRQTNEHIQIWEGWKYSKEEAKAASGIQTIKFFEEFESFLLTLISHIEAIYLDFNEHERNAHFVETAAHRFTKKLKSEFPGHGILRATPILESLRSIKHEEEIIQIQTACDITEKAFRRVCKFIKPGVNEREIEAEIMHEFLRNGATGEAYGSIIASGRNACVLHYTLNNAICNDGDIILMDFGSEYGNYSSDLTRSIPVNGKFTPRQKEVYNAVLRVMKGASDMLIVGNNLTDYHFAVGELMTKELVDLNLITMEQVKNQNPDMPAYKKYFMHGTSHYLGLDTHDVGSRYTPFQAGNVFTCEPGIYILEENIGIRIENDILITEKGNIDLMGSIPREVEEIESLMNS